MLKNKIKNNILEKERKLKERIIRDKLLIKAKIIRDKILFKEKIHQIKKSRQYNYLHNLGMGFWILVLLTFCIGFLFTFYIESMVKIIVSDYGYLGIFFLAIILELVVQPVGPDLPLILGTLAGLNSVFVLIIVLAGCYIALYISYLIGRNIGSAGIERITGKKNFDKIMNKSTSTGAKWFMFLGALTPIPYIPYLVGLWKFSFRDTLIYVIIPRTVRLLIVLLLTYYFGVELLNINIGS